MKLDIAEKGKTVHIEVSEEAAKSLHGMKIGEVVEGSLLDAKFKGFKFQITGLSNIAGFPARRDVEGASLRRVLLSKGVGMRQKGKGLRLKKTIRGNAIAKDIAQVNLKVIGIEAEAAKSLAEALGKAGVGRKVEAVEATVEV